MGTYAIGDLDAVSSVINAANKYNANQTPENLVNYQAALTNAYGSAVTTDMAGSGDVSNEMGASDLTNAYGNSNGELISATGASDAADAYGNGVTMDMAGAGDVSNEMGTSDITNAYGSNNGELISATGRPMFQSKTERADRPAPS